jgi:hypothetical protein
MSSKFMRADGSWNFWERLKGKTGFCGLEEENLFAAGALDQNRANSKRGENPRGIGKK